MTRSWSRSRRSSDDRLAGSHDRPHPRVGCFWLRPPPLGPGSVLPESLRLLVQHRAADTSVALRPVILRGGGPMSTPDDGAGGEHRRNGARAMGGATTEDGVPATARMTK